MHAQIVREIILAYGKAFAEIYPARQIEHSLFWKVVSEYAQSHNLEIYEGFLQPKVINRP